MKEVQRVAAIVHSTHVALRALVSVIDNGTACKIGHNCGGCFTLLVLQLYNEVASVSKSKINLRMVSEEVAHRLTGFGHNAVTPICSATRIPIMVSHRIMQLTDRFYLGAGEVDLKVGMPPQEFVRAFEEWPAWVVDCTTAGAQ